MKLTKTLLIILFFTLPLIHGKLFPTLGINIYTNISGNFEFSKTIFFNIFSGALLCSFLIEIILTKKRFSLSLIRVFLFVSLIISTAFSLSPFMSLIGDSEKGHTALMLGNLIGLYIVLTNIDPRFLKKLLYTTLLAAIIVSVISIKELFFASYNYGALGDRALGTFGHPNYLAGYLLLTLPFAVYIQKYIYRYMAILIIALGIFFSQSIVAIILCLLYLGYLFKLFPKKKSLLVYSLLSALLLGFSILLIKDAPEKLHSFLSRFYLWETTLKIIFSDIKILFLGAGAETLPYYFDSFKVPQVYIYEKFGFTADRPHSFLLNVLFHFGIFAASLFLYLAVSLVKNIKQYHSAEFTAAIMFVAFGIIHFFSVASYLVLIVVLALLTQKSSKKYREIKGVRAGILLSVITLGSLMGGYYSYKFYYAEMLYAQKKYTEAQEHFSHPKYLTKLGLYQDAYLLESIASQQNLKLQLSSLPEKQSLCSKLTTQYPSAENYIHCGNIFWEIDKADIAKQYYKNGLNKLPNLWSEDSPYWSNYFVKNTITGNRFFSEKYGDINSVLKKIDQ